MSGTCTFEAAGSASDLCGELTPNPRGDKCAKAEAGFMGLMLNVCRQRLSREDTIHSSCGTIGVDELISLLDDTLCPANRSESACRQALCFLDALP